MKNTKAGFSLVEAVITITLIAIAAVTALSFIVYCDRLALQADARIAAANFARETMENLYKRDYRDTILNVTIAPISDPLPAGTALNRYPFTPSRRYTVTDMGDYKLITVKVTWNQ